MAEKKEVEETDRSSGVKTVITITVIVYTLLVGGLAAIGRSSFTPKILDSVFGLSSYVLQEVVKRVDSGYSATFVFSHGESGSNGTLLFFAEKGQTVKVSIRMVTRGPNTVPLKVLVDNKVWDLEELPVTHAVITDRLRFDQPPGGDIHVIRFVPTISKPGGLVALECLVLVYNK